MHILCARCLLVSKRIYFMLVLVKNVWSISEFFYQMSVGMEDTFYVCLAFCQTLRDDALHSVTRSLCPRVFVIFCWHPEVLRPTLCTVFFVTGIITCHIGTLGNCSDIWCASRLPFIAQSHFLLNFLATFALFLPLPLSRVSVWASSICLTCAVCSASKFTHCCGHPDLC